MGNWRKKRYTKIIKSVESNKRVMLVKINTISFNEEKKVIKEENKNSDNKLEIIFIWNKQNNKKKIFNGGRKSWKQISSIKTKFNLFMEE